VRLTLGYPMPALTLESNPLDGREQAVALIAEARGGDDRDAASPRQEFHAA
jgi:hypothetical protein